jgi:hypothetical protein
LLAFDASLYSVLARLAAAFASSRLWHMTVMFSSAFGLCWQ